MPCESQDGSIRLFQEQDIVDFTNQIRAGKVIIAAVNP